MSDILLSVKKDKPIDIQTAFTAITLDIIASTAFQFDGFSALDNLAKGWVDDPSKSDDVIPQVFVLDAKVILPSFPEMFFLGFGQLPPKFVVFFKKKEKEKKNNIIKPIHLLDLLRRKLEESVLQSLIEQC